MRAQVRKGFTLVEILIVVVILGILAAIVVPQFTNATQDAQAGNIDAQLQSLNSQIELYRARNNAYPDFTSATVWDDLINDGYLKSVPKNPAASGATSVHVYATYPPTPAATDGWHWGPNVHGVFSLGATFFDEDTSTVTPGVP